MSRVQQTSSDKGMGIDQIRETMTKIREAHYASRKAGANDDDAATYVSTYSDIHGSKLGAHPQSTDLPYRTMKKGSSNKNIESVGSVEESIGAGKRRGRDSIFASSFQAELTGLVGGKPAPAVPVSNGGSNGRARDDSDVSRQHHHHRPAAGQAAVNHNQREYRQQVIRVLSTLPYPTIYPTPRMFFYINPCSHTPYSLPHTPQPTQYISFSQQDVVSVHYLTPHTSTPLLNPPLTYQPLPAHPHTPQFTSSHALTHPYISLSHNRTWYQYIT